MKLIFSIIESKLKEIINITRILQRNINSKGIPKSWRGIAEHKKHEKAESRVRDINSHLFFNFY